MDVAKSRLKTASSGSLHSTYTSYSSHPPSSTSVSRGQMLQRRCALRNVGPTSTLPPSPGPLTSMLKTTTETGDISIFSIQPSVTPTAHHQPPRARPGILDGTTPPRYTTKKGEDFYYTDDRPFRSYRDTTSEIISLYGYDNQAFYMTPGSPILDDNSHRSYSITTNSSRQLPSQKSSGTLQSQSSGNGLQRPRSPFPYPTRLKRPGVRPSSPALADNRCIDYSRMIELDRVSQRTVHGSYKSAYNSWSRRPPPLSLRPEFNRSTASLPSRASPRPYYPGHLPSRSRTPGSSQSSKSRYGPFERHARMPVDRSGRSPSLTSIVDMYRGPSSGKVYRHPSQPACSFYYDYSEDFDKPIASHQDINGQFTPEFPPSQDSDAQNYSGSALTSPIASHPPEGMGVIKAIDQPRVGIDYEATGEAEQAQDSESERDIETTRSSEADDTELSNLIARGRLSLSGPTNPRGPKSPDFLIRNKEEKASVDPPRLSASGTYQILGDGKDKPGSENHRIEMGGNPGSDVTRRTVDATLPDFASIFSSFDLLGKSPCFKGTDMPIQRTLNETDVDSIASSCHNVDNLRHRRNLAAVRISAADLHDESGAPLDVSCNQQVLGILSPEPISAARELKVKNSIPQLMKALPPLPPGHLDLQRQKPQFFSPRNDDLCEQLTNECPGLQNDFQEDTVAHPPKSLSNDSNQTQPMKQNSLPKFKVRVKPSCSPIIGTSSGSHAGTEEQVPVGQQFATVQAKPRLKLKLSRSQIGQGRRANGEELTRINRLKQCNSLADLAPYSNVGIKVDQQQANENNGQGGQSERPVQTVLEHPGVRKGSEDTSPRSSDPFSIPYPPSPEDNLCNKRSLSSSNKDTLVQRPSCSSDSGPVVEKGLRKKMSVLRLRIAESFAAQSSKKCRKVPELDRSGSHISINMTLKGSETNLNNIDNSLSRCGNNVRSDWVASRVKRWATDARRALRSYVRRTLDRSSRLSE